MSYQNYVIASYVIFAAVLAWDFVSTRLQIRRELRNARQRATRQQGRQASTPSELKR